MDPIDEIRQLYYSTTKATITRDLGRAIDLLKAMPDEAARERAAVYMDGLSQMRSEWGAAAGGGVDSSKGRRPGAGPRAATRPSKTIPPAKPGR
jgi:hypothetical protein